MNNDIEVIRIKQDWPDGISDGLISKCAICGKDNIKFDYIVDDELWNRIVPKPLKNKVICLDCLDLLAKSQGIAIGEYIKSLQYTGINETIIFIPSKTYIY